MSLTPKEKKFLFLSVDNCSKRNSGGMTVKCLKNLANKLGIQKVYRFKTRRALCKAIHKHHKGGVQETKKVEPVKPLKTKNKIDKETLKRIDKAMNGFSYKAGGLNATVMKQYLSQRTGKSYVNMARKDLDREMRSEFMDDVNNMEKDEILKNIKKGEKEEKQEEKQQQEERERIKLDAIKENKEVVVEEEKVPLPEEGDIIVLPVSKPPEELPIKDSDFDKFTIDKSGRLLLGIKNVVSTGEGVLTLPPIMTCLQNL